ncbi:MAG: hypothetical protein QOG10_2491 [Kribbellaceae bacterium]|nr:hypothetical protein [Kribbellaceae bacterium]
MEALRPGADDDGPIDPGNIGQFLGNSLRRPVGPAEDLHERLVVRAGCVGRNESSVAGAAFTQQSSLDQPVDFPKDVRLGNPGYWDKRRDRLLALRCE